MWRLKIKYSHSDCIFAPKLKELRLDGIFYYLGSYSKGKFVYTNSLIYLTGDEKSIQKYFTYLKNNKKVVQTSIKKDSVIVLAKHPINLKVYEVAYNPIFIHITPSYLSKDGFEIIEIASWNRADIERYARDLRTNKTTTHFEILKLSELDISDIYISHVLSSLPIKQKEAFLLASNYNYYSFPRKISLDKLSKVAKVSKATYRENLRKAEIKLLAMHK